VVIVAKELTDEDRDRLSRGVERVIQKSDRDEMLQQLSREVAKCIKREARGAYILYVSLKCAEPSFASSERANLTIKIIGERCPQFCTNANCPSAPPTSGD
jgi:hypothetical protein